ncbi:unnamed protein product, partial [Mesorhabditis belari]|uniref:PDZ domain-containing protein n=1 Tax=Mesorhabditis belari TaxID=2138241 RepID=A0AAF3J3B6_9BILA
MGTFKESIGRLASTLPLSIAWARDVAMELGGWNRPAGEMDGLLGTSEAIAPDLNNSSSKSLEEDVAISSWVEEKCNINVSLRAQVEERAGMGTFKESIGRLASALPLPIAWARDVAMELGGWNRPAGKIDGLGEAMTKSTLIEESNPKTCESNRKIELTEGGLRKAKLALKGSLPDSPDVELLKDLSENRSDSLLVELRKQSGQQLGMAIGKRGRGVLVTGLQPGSAAAEKLEVHDRIMAVNAIKVTDQRLAEELVKNSGERLFLQIARPQERRLRYFSAFSPKTLVFEKIPLS